MVSLNTHSNRIQARMRHDKAPFSLGDIMVRYGHLLTSRYSTRQNSSESLCMCLWLHYASVGYHVHLWQECSWMNRPPTHFSCSRSVKTDELRTCSFLPTTSLKSGCAAWSSHSTLATGAHGTRTKHNGATSTGIANLLSSASYSALMSTSAHNAP